MKHSISAVSTICKDSSAGLKKAMHNEASINKENSAEIVFKHSKHHAADKECNNNRDHNLPSKELTKKTSKSRKTCSNPKNNGNKISSKAVGKSVKPFLLKSSKSTKIAQGLITPINWATLSTCGFLKDNSKLSSYANTVHMPSGTLTALSSCTSFSKHLKSKHSKGMPQSVTFCSSYRKPTITDPIYLHQYYKKNWKNCHIPGESCLPICLETREGLRFLNN